MSAQVDDVELDSAEDNAAEDNAEDNAATKQIQSDQEEVGRYTNLLNEQMAPLKVVAAHQAGDLAALEDAIKNLEDLDMGQSPPAIAARKIYDQINEERYALLKAMDDRDLKEIKKRLESLKKNDYRKNARGELPADRPRISVYLKVEIKKAQNLIRELELASKVAPTAILAMDKKTMTELKCYAKPPPIVHRVMQAAFLLLDEDEEKTSSWSYCQKLCVPDGPNGLNRKMMKLTPENIELHDLIIKRARQLLKGIDLRAVQKASPGAATFYVWVMSILPPRDDEQNDNPGGQESTPRAKEPKMTPEDQKKQARREQARLMKWIQTEKEIFKAKSDAERAKRAEREAQKPAPKNTKPAPKKDYFNIRPDN